MNETTTANGTAVGSPVGTPVSSLDNATQRPEVAQDKWPEFVGGSAGDHEVVPTLGDPPRGRKRWTADEDTAVLLIEDDAAAAAELGRTVAAIKSRRGVLVRFGPAVALETPHGPPGEAVEGLGDDDEPAEKCQVGLDGEGGPTAKNDDDAEYGKRLDNYYISGLAGVDEDSIALGSPPPALRVAIRDHDSGELIAVSVYDEIAVGEAVAHGVSLYAITGLRSNNPRKFVEATARKVVTER